MSTLRILNFRLNKSKFWPGISKGRSAVSQLLLMLSFFISVATSASADNDVLLKQEVGPLLSAPGQYFDIINNVKRWHPESRVQTEVKHILGGEKAYDAIERSLHTSDADQLAEDFIHAIDGLVTTTASREFLRGLEQGSGRTMNNTINEIHLKDGRSLKIPLQDAITYHSWYVHEIASQASKQVTSVRISGNYIMESKGSCAIKDDFVDILQDGNYFEGWRGGRLVLWGSVGKKLVYMQLAESKFVVVRGPKENSSVHFPDKPSLIYKASVNDLPLQFHSIQASQCSLALKIKK